LEWPFFNIQVLLKSSEIPEFRKNLVVFLLIILKSEKNFNFITIVKYALFEKGVRAASPRPAYWPPGVWPPAGRNWCF
jgi:hypothetical protein